MNQELSFFYELISCMTPLSHWKYAADGHLLESNCEEERILDIIFSAGGFKEQMVKYGKEHSMPLILSSPLGNLWITTFEKAENKVKAYHVLGPVFTDILSPNHIQKRINQFNIPVSWKNRFIQLIKRFPTVPWTTLVQYTIMLHYTVTKETITVSDFSYQSDAKPATEPPLSQDTSEGKKNLPWMSEQALLNNIREGNLNYQSALSNASAVSSGVKIDVGDPLRRAIDSSIVFIALCTRAAIDGGMSAQSAYTLQNMYTQNVEASQSLADTAAINHQMYEDFIHRVHKLKEISDISPQVRSCCEYIEMHASEKISIQNLAESVGYTDYYLSRKFKKETGCSINEYIRRKKISQAKTLLSATHMNIQEISEQLNFCSRSYFTDTFHKVVGMSPVDYRNQNLKN